MSFPRYPKYKDSGVEWVGEVPEHWTLPPLYRRYEALLGKMLDEKQIAGDYLVPYLRNTDVQWDCVNTADLPQMDVSPDERDRFMLQDGDLLVCEGGEVGKSAIWQGQLRVCAYQKAIHRLRALSDQEDTRFLFYCIWSAAAAGAFIAGANPNTINHLTSEKLRRYRFPCPPLREQREISAFLDSETAKIDALLTEQQRLIELLQDKRQAAVSHAVTKGLNSGIPLKPSGTAWLGEVPAHWNETRLRWLFRQQKRQGCAEKNVLSVYREFGVVPKDSRDDNFNKTPDDLSTYQLVNPGDLVVNKMKAWQGSLGISEYEGITSPDYMVFAPQHHDSPVFLHHLLRSKRLVSVYRSISNGIRLSQWRLESDAFLELPVFLPPRDEQEDIAAFVTDESARVDALISASEASIVLLRERRSALISAAVTGKIDVRNYAADQAEAA